MPLDDEGYALLPPEAQRWIPNADLLRDLHVDSWELYFLLEGTGRMRVGARTITVPKHGCALVAPRMLRQIFNDTPQEALWLIVASPQERLDPKTEPARFYPEDPKSFPAELAGRIWPPK